jgi:hypothetical protein
MLSRVSMMILMNTMTARNVARVASLKSLRFGTELEIADLTAERAIEAVQSVVGGTVTVGTTYLRGFDLTMADGRVWKSVTDASVRDSSGRTHREGGRACEVVSPILTWTDMDTVQAIARALRAAGGRVNHTTGMHVHVDGAAFKTSPAKVRNLIALAYRWESVAINMARVLRERHQWCGTLGAELVERFRTGQIKTIDSAAMAWYGNGRTSSRDGHYDQSRYRWINVHALFDKGTIEFRLFNGTLHAGQIKANILFALGMASTALTSKSISFRGQTTETRTLPDGRRAVSAHDNRMFIVHVLCLVGDEFKTYRKHLAKAISGETA